MFVRTESLPQAPHQHLTVRVHTPIGSAVVLWRGDLPEADGRHLIEWTVDADLHWGQNTRSAATTEPKLQQEGNQVIMRGRLQLTDDGAAYLQMGHWSVLFELASPIPSSMDESWVEISVSLANRSISVGAPPARAGSAPRSRRADDTRRLMVRRGPPRIEESRC
ncbi:hypothetical protein AB0O22_18205 [Streptomyces sp. NPDC091204]|uniref:hypothetical protein n=1 Tax=Streptomyces sp. NPDC091204 TaxID=3155299 RepID=UPI003439B383